MNALRRRSREGGRVLDAPRARAQYEPPDQATARTDASRGLTS